MRLTPMTTWSARAGLVMLLAGCPFNNPYEYYGQECSVDKPCAAPGLECVDGTCQGSHCTADSECQAPFDTCVDGRCALRGQADAAARDGVGVDAVAIDGADADAAGGDAAGSDAGDSDGAGSDTGAVDATGSDAVVVGDGGAGDGSAGADGAIADAPAADTAHADAAAGWDAAAAVSCTTADPCAGGRCVDGYCRPLLCGRDDDCVSPDFHCARVTTGTTTYGGLCAPATCVTSPDCMHPLLTCMQDQLGNLGCWPRRGQPYQACVPEADGSSWCDDGLTCVQPYGGTLGTCQRLCRSDQDCTYAGSLCVGVATEAALTTDGVGICMATCGSYAIADPLPGDPELHCSLPTGLSAPGLLLSIPEVYVGMSCNGPADCGGPFVCVDLGQGDGNCMLGPEALLWQARGELAILVGDLNGDSVPDTCGDGLYAVSHDAKTLCLPRCLDDNDCRFAVPQAATPACQRSTTHPTMPGFCSVAAPFTWRDQSSCFRPDLVVNGTTCSIASGIDDGDGDGFFSGVDQCPQTAGGMGGCLDWPCRVDEECGDGRWCLIGRCVAASDVCHTTCRSDELAVEGYCTSPDKLCISSKDPFSCIRDTDCTAAMCDGSSGNCVCIANACLPDNAAGCPTPYLDGCVPPEFVNQVRVACADNMDCPATAFCETGDHRCYAKSVEGQTCETAADCPSPLQCAAGYCWPVGTLAMCPDSFSGSACLDCDLLNGADARWSLPLPKPATGCPCGMAESAGLCFGKRVLCPQANSQCPPAMVCRAGRCLAAEGTQPGECPPWHAATVGACASCIDALAEPQRWGLPCYASGDPLCPCGLQCVPDAGGVGACSEAPWLADCVAALSDGDACEGGGVWFDGKCRHERGCSADNECDQGWVCLPTVGGAGGGFCVPQTTIACNALGDVCGGQWRGICVVHTGNTFCVPEALVPRGAQLRTCTGALQLCGPSCVCMTTDGTSFWSTELRPRDCLADAFGLGDTCLARTTVTANPAVLAPGQRCSQGQLPGIADQNARCLPTAQALSPGCGQPGECLVNQRCQVGTCFGACTLSAQCSAANPDTACVEMAGTTRSLCRPQPVVTATGACSHTSPYCAYKGIPGGGLCLLNVAGGAMCYPRVGCDLAAADEVCVDGAPVPTAVLAAQPSCTPWVRSSCAFPGAICGAGLCHPTEANLGVCGAAASCGHWMQCGSGEVCLGQQCRPYAVDASELGAGAACDGRPYGAGQLGGVVWPTDVTGAAGRCLRKDDPRCGGRTAGQACDQVSDPRSKEYRPTLVCSQAHACVEVDMLEPCAQPGTACDTATGLTGFCTPTLRGLRCLP